MPHRAPGAALLLALALAACTPQPAQPLAEENEMLATRVTDLESQLATAQAQADALATAIGAIDASIADVDRSLLDLTPEEWQIQIPNVQAALAVVKQRTADARGAADAVSQSLAIE